jgi:tRNA dimethylallyltransferase
MTMFDGKALVIVGPTASGKSALALKMAAEFDGEIVSCDSVQVYRGFDIGSAKPTSREQEQIHHHMIDLVDCHEDYDARSYSDDAHRALLEIAARSRLPVICGGTGLYLRALQGADWHDLPKDEGLRAELDGKTTEELVAELNKLDPERAGQIHPNDRYRLSRAIEIARLTGSKLADLPKVESRKSPWLTVKIMPPRAILHQRIKQRTQAMLRDGLIAEVERLLKSCSAECKPMQSIGYKQVCEWLGGENRSKLVLEEAIMAATRQYAKRQCTWFNKTPAEVHISSVEEDWPRVVKVIRSYLND